MTSFAKQFDAAQHDIEWLNRPTQEDILELDDMDDDYITHMKFECRKGVFL